MKREREQWTLEQASGKQLTSELTKEVDSLRKTINCNSELSRAGSAGSTSDSTRQSSSRIAELEHEIKDLKQQNNSNISIFNSCITEINILNQEINFVKLNHKEKEALMNLFLSN